MKLSLFFLVFVLFVLAVSCAHQPKMVVPKTAQERGEYIQQAIDAGFDLGHGSANSAASYKKAWAYMQSLKKVDSSSSSSSEEVHPPVDPPKDVGADPLQVDPLQVDPLQVDPLLGAPKGDGGKGGVDPLLGAPKGDGGKGGNKGKKVAPPVPTEIKFLSELVYGFLTIVPYKLSMWAVAEVFPDFSLEQVREHQYTQLVMSHSVVKPVADFLSSGFAMSVIVVLFFPITGLLGISGKSVHFLRRVFFAVSIGLLFAALADVGFQVISNYVADENLDKLAYWAQNIESAIFFVTMSASVWAGFKKQVVMSLMGSLFIFFWFHFIEDGKVHWDYKKTLPQSAAAADLEGMKKTAESVVEGGKKLVKDTVEKMNPSEKKSTGQQPSAAPEQQETK